MAPAVAPMEDAAPMEEPNEELAAPTAMPSRLTEEPDIPPVWHVRSKKRGRYPIAAFLAGQRCCIPLGP